MKNQEKSCKVTEVAKIIINRCTEKGYSIDDVKLQQLLTLIQGTMLAKYNIPFFTQDIYVFESPIIKEVLYGIITKEINFEVNINNDCVLSSEENLVLDEIINKFGIYDSDILKNLLVLNVINKIKSKNEILIPIEYLKIVFEEFGFGITNENKSAINDNKKLDRKFKNIEELYSDLISISSYFPKKWLPDPETRCVPSEPDLVKLSKNTVENGFIEKFCLDEDQVKQLRLIRYYKKNYEN